MSNVATDTTTTTTIATYPIPAVDSLLRADGRAIRVRSLEYVEHPNGDRSLLAHATKQCSPGSRETDEVTIPIHPDDLPEHIAQHVC